MVLEIINKGTGIKYAMCRMSIEMVPVRFSNSDVIHLYFPGDVRLYDDIGNEEHRLNHSGHLILKVNVDTSTST